MTLSILKDYLLMRADETMRLTGVEERVEAVEPEWKWSEDLRLQSCAWLPMGVFGRQRVKTRCV